LEEEMQSGWQQTGMYCQVSGGVKITAEGEAYGHHGMCSGWNGCGDAATCAQWACEVNGYNSVISYGDERPCTEFDDCNLFYERGSVDMNWRTRPDCPVMGVTDIVCSNGSSDDSSEYRRIEVMDQDFQVNPGDQINCYVGNQYITPELTIEKSNNRWPNRIGVGDLVEYKIVVKAEKNPVYNLKVHDLLSGDIKYQSGSYKAVSSVNGVLAISEPTYASPGVWTLPTIEAGEVIALSYLGKVQDGTDPGTYKDVAWASGTIGANDSTQVMARAGSEGYLANAFVGTRVLVDRSLQSSADVNVIEEKKQGKVLGATTLPATGANTAWLIGSLILIGAGAGLMLVSGKKRGKKCVN